MSRKLLPKDMHPLLQTWQCERQVAQSVGLLLQACFLKQTLRHLLRWLEFQGPKVVLGCHFCRKSPVSSLTQFLSCIQ